MEDGAGLLTAKVTGKRGLLFNIQRFSIHDGPGIRTTVFMKGCPLVCAWCSNPESQRGQPEIMTVDRKCIGCGKCVEICPQEAIELDESGRKIDREKCNLCMECATACPSGAIEAVGRYMTVGDVVAEAERDRPFYRNSGGGVTISGGEPFLQWEFTREVLKECKKRDLATALDTSGYAPWDVVEQVLEYVDLALYDLKYIDSSRHKEDTGVANKLILQNAEKVSGAVRTWIRFPVIPGHNDSDLEVEMIAEFSSRLPIEKVSVLPYHGMGAQKYERLGRVYPLEGVTPPSQEHLEDICKVFDSFGLEATVGR